MGCPGLGSDVGLLSSLSNAAERDAATPASSPGKENRPAAAATAGDSTTARSELIDAIFGAIAIDTPHVQS